MILKLLLAGFIGFIIGVVLTVFLLCEKNLERYTKIQSKAAESVKQNYAAAKALYNAEVNGGRQDEAENEDASDDGTAGQPADGADLP